MKILLTSDHHPKNVNGVVVSTMNLFRELRKKGEDVRMLCLSPTTETYVEDDIYYIGSIPFNVYPDVRASISPLNPLIRRLIDWSPEIIHSQCEFFTYTYVEKIARHCHCPIIHTYHTMYEHYVRYVLPIGNWARLVAPVMRRRLNTADVIIAPTKKTWASLNAGRIGRDVRIIPTGIDLDRYSAGIDDVRRRELLDSLGIPADAHLFGSVGRLAKEKNLDEVLRAFKSVSETDPQAYLLLVGDGSYRKQLESQAEHSGIADRVIFTGMIPAERIYEYYRLMAFFVSASISETQGLTYIEALANGLPVIARRDPAVEEVVVDGVNGYLFDTTLQLVELIRRLFSDDALLGRLTEGAWRSRDRFSKAHFADAVLALYREVVNRETPPKHKTVTLRASLSAKIKQRTISSDYGQFYSTIQSKIQRSRFRRQQKHADRFRGYGDD